MLHVAHHLSLTSWPLMVTVLKRAGVPTKPFAVLDPSAARKEIVDTDSTQNGTYNCVYYKAIVSHCRNNTFHNACIIIHDYCVVESFDGVSP